MRRLLFFFALAALLGSAIYGLRSVPRFTTYYTPVGQCIAGPIDLNNAAPFAKLELEGTVLGLAASGGGSRAAYLTAAILREIRRSELKIETPDRSNPATSLLDQIDVMSAVSGSSLALAYFVANAANLKSADPDGPTWSAYLDKMAHSYRRNQYWKALQSPSIWAKFLATNYHHGILARDDYDEALFDGATLASLPQRPVLYINAFDVANHVRFVFSKHFVETDYYQPRDAGNILSAPHDITSANSLSRALVDPASVPLADAVYASAAFPIAYPNMALEHCPWNAITFQGRKIFLADGAIADNSGLITLLTQLRAALLQPARRSAVLAISIDASLDRVATSGTVFTRRGIEETYAWRNVILGHGMETINAASLMMQNLGTRFIESTGALVGGEVSRIPEITKRSGRCGPQHKASWENLFESGKLSLRPLVIRLGLRDLTHPQFGVLKDAWRAALPEEQKAKLAAGLALLQRGPPAKLTSIETDFALSDAHRETLDWAAFLLVHVKLAIDLAEWNEAAVAGAAAPDPGVTCPP